MEKEIAPRQRKTVFCAVVGHDVEHVVVTLECGRIRWCQNCFVVMEEADWQARCGAAGYED